MELFSDKPALAAAALTRLVAADIEAKGRPVSSLRAYLSDLVVRNGPSIVEELAVELARQHLATLDRLAEATGRPAARYLDDIELAAAMGESMGRDSRDPPG
ncbi:hypothetical protein NMQ03_15995 [Arthrobacter sp. DNA4]|uniref:hypothetical protein n=1 Tax=Arthrobacter sp. DNA4 TaxID=2963432 RepID=UPI0020CD63BF|nr:hypothetical protein [Arthrobacter sp. DNA4]UTT68714.1 hypothetical protein NMQ03_15995 [Arthrobacter sp. DNA4]